MVGHPCVSILQAIVDAGRRADDWMAPDRRPIRLATSSLHGFQAPCLPSTNFEQSFNRWRRSDSRTKSRPQQRKNRRERKRNPNPKNRLCILMLWIALYAIWRHYAQIYTPIQDRERIQQGQTEMHIHRTKGSRSLGTWDGTMICSIKVVNHNKIN